MNKAPRPAVTATPAGQKQRDLVFDALKFFAIFMVLWGHSIQHLSAADEKADMVYQFIHSFHMPLFMTMVGYFAGSVLRLTFKELLIKKGRQLLLPALVVGVAFAIPGVRTYDPIEAAHQYIGSLWFLKSAFCCFILYYLSVKTLRRQWLAAAVSLLIALFIHRYQLKIMYPCFLFGILLNRNFSLVKRFSGIITIFSGIIFATIFCLARNSIFPAASSSASLTAAGSLTATLQIAQLLATRLTIGLSGTLFFIALFEFLSERIPKTIIGTTLCHWGQQTLGIYIFQTLILEIIFARYISLDGMDGEIFHFVVTPLISILTLLLCLALINLAERSRLLSTLLLGKEYR